MVGNDTKDYKLGAGLYLKAGYPVSQGDDITLEAGGYIFSLYDNSFKYGTAVVPAKVGIATPSTVKAMDFTWNRRSVTISMASVH